MAKISNPRKQFRFSIEFIGMFMDPWLVQEVEHPEITTEKAEHGDVNRNIKTAGRTTYGDAAINKLMATSGPDNFLFNWNRQCNDVKTGGGLVPDAYKKSIIITEFAEDGITGINTWVWEGCWPTKINGQTNSRLVSDNTIESFELSVDGVDKI